VVLNERSNQRCAIRHPTSPVSDVAFERDHPLSRVPHEKAEEPDGSEDDAEIHNATLRESRLFIKVLGCGAEKGGNV